MKEGEQQSHMTSNSEVDQAAQQQSLNNSNENNANHVTNHVTTNHALNHPSTSTNTSTNTSTSLATNTSTNTSNNVDSSSTFSTSASSSSSAAASSHNPRARPYSSISDHPNNANNAIASMVLDAIAPNSNLNSSNQPNQSNSFSARFLASLHYHSNSGVSGLPSLNGTQFENATQFSNSNPNSNSNSSHSSSNSNPNSNPNPNFNPNFNFNFNSIGDKSKTNSTTPSSTASSTSSLAIKSNTKPVFDKTLLCPICLQVLTEPFMSRCGHSFCLTCITTCLASKPECPVCKAPATKDALFPNFLAKELIQKINVDHVKYVQDICSSTEWNPQDINLIIKSLQTKQRAFSIQKQELELQILADFLSEAKLLKMEVRYL